MPDAEPDAYADLLERYREVACLQTTTSVLEWDEYVTMPEGGATVRTQQTSVLSSLAQERLGDPAVGELLDALAERDLSAEQRAVTRERDPAAPRAGDKRAGRDRGRALRTDERGAAGLDGGEGDGRLRRLRPHLEAIVEKKREYAHAVDPDAGPYAVLVGEFVPQLEYGTVERVLGRLEAELPPLIEAVRESDADLETDVLHGDHDEDAQFAAARDLLDALGFDWSEGRLDTFERPFTLGLPSDARVCTWTDWSLY